VDVIEAQYGPSNSAVQHPQSLDDMDDEAIAALERTSTYNPLIGGISCGNPRVTAGTLGAIVYDRQRCKPMILSNWHVLAGASAAAIGEDILQPGQLDGGTEVVASLTRMKLDSRMDAAVATLNNARSSSRDILGLGTIAGIDTPTLGMNVIKSGRTTGITRGVVDGVSLSVSINYGDPGVVAFSNQIRIVPRPPWPAVDYEVSMGGDSGSVWLRESNNRAIGLHFAGETDPLPSSENAICSPIGPIATELNFSFTPVLCPVAPVRPVFDICRRYPWICRRFLRDPFPRFGFQDADGSGVGDDEARMMDELRQYLDKSSDGECDCGCGCKSRGGNDQIMMAILAAVLSNRR
jgi:endonuclease G